MNIPSHDFPLPTPNFSDQEIKVLKKYFEFNKKYVDIINAEIDPILAVHPVFGPMIQQMTPEIRKAQNERSQEQQRAAIFDGKWHEYAQDLMTQGKVYARMNISYTDWYDLIKLYKVKLLPHIKRDFANSVEDAVDFIDGLTKFIDYAMYGIAEAYFQEKNEIIRAREARFKQIFENSEDQILLVGKDFNILAINHSLLDADPESLVGKSIFDFLGEENAEKVKEVINICLSEEEAATFETDTGPDDNKKYYASTVSPVTPSQQEGATSVVIITRDITRRKQAELKLHELNRTLEKKVEERTNALKNINQELESFTYSVSHDLRGPLRAINGFSEILKEECGDGLNEGALDALSEITDNAKKMGLLIDNLLEFSRLGKQNVGKALVDMNELFHSVVAELKNTAGPNTKFKITSMEEALGDRSMLKQVALNLVSNAIKYSSKKESPVIEIGATTNGVGTVYFVKDNGAGFNMKYYDKLFGVFQRLHNSEFEGIGVGLAIVSRIVSRHLGKVWAEGKENEGATFYFTLPKN